VLLNNTRNCYYNKVYKRPFAHKITENEAFLQLNTMNKKNIKMNKNILVSVLLIASILFTATAVSAYSFGAHADFSNLTVRVNGEPVYTANGLPTVNAGDTITVQAKFTSEVADSVKVKMTLEGSNDDVVATTSAFDVEDGKNYIKTLTLKVPSDFDKDELTADFPLTLEIGDEEVELGDLHVQRTSYDVAIKSVLTSSTLSTGASVPVQIVLKNVGYNDVEDLYVTVSLPELNVEKQVYFGDLVTVKDDSCDNDDDDCENSVVGTVYLDIPYNAKSGVYTLSVEVASDDSKNTATKQVTIENSVSEIAMKSGNNLVLLNPTSKLAVYKVSYQGKNVAVVIPAQSSQTVPIDVPASGDYKFDVSVFSGDTVLSTVNFAGTSEAQTASPVLVLTVILAIVFLVLLVVLVVLITKKPQKAEEFGESYY
jgi:hypothetical protein